MEIKHTSIMVQEIINHVPENCKLYVDGTAGHGWHIAAIAASGKLTDDAHIVAIDRDGQMLAKARETLVSVMTRPAGSLMYVQDTYANLPSIVQDKKIDFILLDIGVNMEHFKDGSRGFSVHEDAPLDMRFDTREWQTAADIVNTADKQVLMHMFVQYGDFAPKSAEYFTDNMIEARKKEPILTTKQLIDFFYSIGVRKNQLPVIFQCLRIQTNQELEQLETFLKVFPNCLASWGRCAIMTFHSTEDRIVKYAFKALDDTWDFTLVNKKVIVPHYTEVQKNRAARSAKLRIIEKK
jgi:16S rRNA (cytosine1402-N4)-methyltransferase